MDELSCGHVWWLIIISHDPAFWENHVLAVQCILSSRETMMPLGGNVSGSGVYSCDSVTALGSERRWKMVNKMGGTPKRTACKRKNILTCAIFRVTTILGNLHVVKRWMIPGVVEALFVYRARLIGIFWGLCCAYVLETFFNSPRAKYHKIQSARNDQEQFEYWHDLYHFWNSWCLLSVRFFALPDSCCFQLFNLRTSHRRLSGWFSWSPDSELPSPWNLQLIFSGFSYPRKVLNKYSSNWMDYQILIISPIFWPSLYKAISGRN